MTLATRTAEIAGKAFDEHVAPVLTDSYTVYFKRLHGAHESRTRSTARRNSGELAGTSSPSTSRTAL